MNNTIISTKKENKELMARAKRINSILKDRGSEQRVRYVQCWKNNVCLDGFTIITPGFNASPTLYYHPIWERISDYELLDELLHIAKEQNKNIPVREYMTKDYILAHVKPYLISEKNKSSVDQNHFVNMNYLDMLILFKVEVEEMSDEKELASYTIRDNLLEAVEIDLQELFVAAVQNIEADTQVIKMLDYIKKYVNMDGLDDEDVPLFILTNSRKLNGAACCLSSTTLKRLEDMLDGDIVIIPSSIHEVIIAPKTNEIIEALSGYIGKVNKTLDKEEVLTDSVYISHDGVIYKVD